MTKCSCGQRDKDKCNKENGLIEIPLNQGKMCLKEENNYVPRHIRQKIERDAWIDDAADYLIEIGIYNPDEFNYACERVKALMHWNIDEGGDLIEIDAREFLKGVMREVLEE